MTDTETAAIEAIRIAERNYPSPPSGTFNPEETVSADELDLVKVHDEIFYRLFKGMALPEWLNTPQIGYLIYLHLREKKEAEAAVA